MGPTFIHVKSNWRPSHFCLKHSQVSPSGYNKTLAPYLPYIQSDSCLQFTALSGLSPGFTPSLEQALSSPSRVLALLFSWLPRSHQSHLKVKYPFLIEDVPPAQYVLCL